MMKLQRKKKMEMGHGGITAQVMEDLPINTLISTDTLHDHQIIEGMTLTTDGQDLVLEIDRGNIVLDPLTNVPLLGINRQDMDQDGQDHALVIDHEVGHRLKALIGQWPHKKNWLVD